MVDHFADRLLAEIERKNAPVCVGLDPVPGRLPDPLRRLLPPNVANGGLPDTDAERDAAAEALVAFGHGVIEAVAPLVPALKINIAFFEPLRAPGWQAYEELVRAAHKAGLLVIGDIKRADIGHSSTQYARAHLAGDETSTTPTADAVTVNPYFGAEGVDPFCDLASRHGRGVFVLVQTSNASAETVQGLSLADGSTVADRVAALVHAWSADPECLGTQGYSCVGAVVSPRDLPSTRRLREAMPHCLFLVPGFGAQGRSAAEVALCFRPDGRGAIVNASRSVIYAYEKDSGVTSVTPDWTSSIARACTRFVEEVREAIRPNSTS